MKKYFGITHFLPEWNWIHYLWRRFLCVRNCHCFDEVYSGGEHYLSCDVCELVVFISFIDTTFVSNKVLENILKNERKYNE